MLRRSGITPLCLELNEAYGIQPDLNKIPSNSLNKIGMPLEEVVNYIEHSEFYIGLSSGLAWVAHALGKPTAMIANFTEDWNEFDINTHDYKRITNKSVCHGCWNNSKYRFDANPFVVLHPQHIFAFGWILRATICVFVGTVYFP